jgi:CBS domain containing-hemolysin-like protein
VSPFAVAALVLLLVLLEGFFSGSEIALVSANRIELANRAQEGNGGARRVLALLERPDRLLGTCLVGTNLCVVAASTLVTHAVMSRLDHPMLASLILAPVILLFAEMLPKTVYEHHANRLAPIVVYPIEALAWVFTPFLIVIELLDRAMMWITRAPRGTPLRPVSREEIRLLLDAPEQGDIDEDDRDMIRKVFEFGDARVEEAMMPLVEVMALPRKSTVAEAAAMMVETGFSRLPVFDGRIDAIVGIVTHRDLLAARSIEDSIDCCLCPVPFVPETKRLEDLFLELRKSRQHLAVVVDEYGGSTGIITLEDIMEEIIGDIHDEFDDEPLPIKSLGDRQWLVGARVEREPLAEHLNLVLPEGDFETLAGFLLCRLGHVPSVGERLLWNEWKFTVAKATDRAILEVTVAKQPPPRKVS